MTAVVMEADAAHLQDKREEFLTARQLAELLQVSESTVRRLAREGRIPAVRLTSRLIRFQRSAVLHALNGTQQKSRPRRPTHATEETQLSFDDLL